MEDDHPDLSPFHHDSSSSLPPALDSFPLQLSFDHGYFLTVRAIQEFRDKKKGSVSVGIGGPSGSGKSSLASKIASVLGGSLIAMENYHDPSRSADDGNDFDCIDFELLLQNLHDLIKGKSIMMPQFDFREKRRAGFKPVKAPKSGVVIIEGTYALHSKLRPSLNICVAVVGGVHFNLLSKVRRDIGGALSLDYLIDSIFPMFRTHIEPDLHHAQIKISNSFASLSLREPYYILKCDKQTLKAPMDALFSSSNVFHEKCIEMFLRPPVSAEAGKISDWIRMRQCGIRYDLAEGDQRIVDKNFIIKPRVEFEVGKTTLGGLLALGYQVAVSYKRESAIVDNGKVIISIEHIDDLDKSFIQVKGTDRKVVAAEAQALGLDGPWLTKSYVEMVLDTKGLPRMDSPPLPLSTILSSLQTSASPKEMQIISPQPVRLRPVEPPLTSIDSLDTWTRSPTKSDADSVVGSWHVTNSFGPSSDNIQKSADVPFTAGNVQSDINTESSSFVREHHEHRHLPLASNNKVKLLPMSGAFDFDRGLPLAVQAVQTLLNTKGRNLVVGIGGPSGSGKTSLARKMANIVGCEVIAMESYYRPDALKDYSYDDFRSLDLPLLLANIKDIKRLRPTRIPIFDFETCARTGSWNLEVSEDCGVVVLEGVYALHPEIRPAIDICIAVVGGVHSHLVARVQQDLEQSGHLKSQQDVMTTLFPMFQQYIEPHLKHAHLKISNDFDPVHSPECSMFVLKSCKDVTFEGLSKVLDPERMVKTVQNFTDLYFHLPGLPAVGICSESNSIRVRYCEGRFALLIREPITEGDFIIQPRIDFDISVQTVAGLLALGYEALAYIDATATIYQDGKLLVEVDHLENIQTSYIQIKGSNKEAVAAAGQDLNLDGSYTTKPYIDIILGQNLSMLQNSGICDPQAARLQELVDFVRTQSLQGMTMRSRPLAPPGLPPEYKLEALEIRLSRLEKLQMINTVLWTFFMSAFVGYLLYQRKQRTRS